ncbi:uncharacterized protein LOC121040108 [Herpailurus yagouaroundi]|uniref:uncharacterized protein LOC121040108 n=1 Tax=Herpailurus yagouaroundi TaxID=1608482 RepID=UPI001AD71473|nr:uncharacterized protein LOC121040108 [Puma yagouaroundi]
MGMAHAQTSVNVPAPQALLLCARAQKVAGPAQSWAGRLPGSAPSRSVPRRPGFPRSHFPHFLSVSPAFLRFRRGRLFRSVSIGVRGRRREEVGKGRGGGEGRAVRGHDDPCRASLRPTPTYSSASTPAGVDASRGCARMSCAVPAGGGGPGESVHRNQLLALTHRTAPTPSSSPYIRPDYAASGLPGTPFTDPDHGFISNHDRCPRP